jgi:hypothetical protein
MSSKSPPDIIYHYTSQDGLVKILNTKVLWASHILYLNDHKEFQHAFELTKEKLEGALSNCKSTVRRATLKRCHEELDHFETCAAFVASFSEDGDLLSQWRGYGGDGNGFAIGFDRFILDELAWSTGWRLGPCIYSPNMQSRKLSSLIASTIGPKFEGHPSYVNAEGVTTIFVQTPDSRLAGELSHLSPLLKHPAFSQEREWRLTLPENFPIEIHHRPGRSMLIPYCHFPLINTAQELNCIREIVIGPGPHSDLSKKSLQSLLKATGLSGIELRQSKIPYRTW